MSQQMYTYNKVSTVQKEDGLELISKLSVREGMTVLDQLGCGTGYLSGVLAEQIGPSGQVLGVDPDKERIRVAQDTYSGLGNLPLRRAMQKTLKKVLTILCFQTMFSTGYWTRKLLSKKVPKALKPGGMFGFLTVLKHNEYFDKLMDSMENTLARDRASEMFHYVPEEYYTELEIASGLFWN